MSHPSLIRDSDQALEARIDSASRALLEAQRRQDWTNSGQCWRELVRLISERSPERVAQMERERGLR